MILKYSLSHLMLIFVILGLICLWNIQRKKIESLTEQLNQSQATLKTTLNATKTFCAGAKQALDVVKEDSHLSIDSHVALASLYTVFDELNRKAYAILKAQNTK
jgi:hypothetical protein